MSNLEILKESLVFHHNIVFADANHLYRPFGEISKEDPELELLKSVQKGFKAIIKGCSGSGKSSLINYTLLQLGKEFIPFACNVIGYGDNSFSNPADFARFILNSVLRHVRYTQELTKFDKKQIEEFKRYLSGEISYKEGKSNKLIGQIKNKFSWIPLFFESSFDIGGELGEYTEKALKKKLYADDPIQSINDIVSICAVRGLTPVYILDDTDKFLGRPEAGIEDSVEPFFNNAAPILKQLDCPVIFPTHNFYDKYKIYKNYEKNMIDSLIAQRRRLKRRYA